MELDGIYINIILHRFSKGSVYVLRASWGEQILTEIFGNRKDTNCIQIQQWL